MIYAVAYIGNMLIESHYTLAVDLSTFSSLAYILILPIIGYFLNHFFTKRVAWNLAEILLDDLGEFGLLAEEKLKNTLSLESKMNKEKKKFFNGVAMLQDLDTIYAMIKFNYFIVFTFSMLVTICNYTQVNIAIYTLIQALFLIVISSIAYILSFKAKRQIKYILNKLNVVSIVQDKSNASVNY